MSRRKAGMQSLLLHSALATLPADNGGVPSFAAGDLYSGGSVVCTNFSGSSATGTYVLPLGPEVDGAAMIVFALQPSDLFTQNMASANVSLDTFLNSDAVGSQAVGATSYLFLAYGPDDTAAAVATAAFRERLIARLAAVNLSLSTLDRMHFGAQQASTIKGLGSVLKQWTTPVNSIRVQLDDGSDMNISRLDGKYEVCSWPLEDQPLLPLVDAGSGCAPLDAKLYAGKTAVVRSDNCTQEEAAQNGGNIVVAAKGDLPRELAHGCRNGAFMTVVSSDEGAALLAALSVSKQQQLNASLFSRRMPGAFAAIDSAGALQEVKATPCSATSP